MIELRQKTEIGHIPLSWNYQTLLDIASPDRKAIISGPFGSNISRKFFVDSGVPVIRGGNLSLEIGTKFIDDGFVFVTHEKAKSLNTWATANDLVFTAVGTIGQVGLITDSQRYQSYIISNKQLRVTLDEKKIIPLFAYYWCASDLIQQWILRRNTGSSVPLINLSILKALPVPVPPLSEQRAITAVLSSLDDKIDLLHRQNKTLESLAQTLFRHWFIDGADDDWEEVPLGEVIKTTSGGTPSRKKMEYFENGTIPWVKSKELNGSFLFETEEMITDDALNNSSAKMLPTHTVIIAMYGATVGEYSLLATPATCNQAICALLPNQQYPYTFLFMLAKNNKDELINMAVGSAQQNISQKLIQTLCIPAPSPKIHAYHEQVLPLFDRIKANVYQIHTLEALRDTLLPKLMSGEVRVRL